MEKRYEWTITLAGQGENAEEAWENALEFFYQDPGDPGDPVSVEEVD